MKQMYAELRMRAASLKLIEVINAIIVEFRDNGYTLTVRQLYYQLVSRDVIPNHEKSYKNITRLVNDGRIAGLIDWDMIEDRTRDFMRRPSWSSPKSIVQSAAESFHMDMWYNQDTRVYCIIEKDALRGVMEGVCHKWDVPLLAARGYPSASVIREFAVQDMLQHGLSQDIVILHFGDHDPSGIDMTRDLQERLDMFSEGLDFQLHRIALNMPQIEELKPPPNPAKNTDARFVQYRKKFGSQSWELDALPPHYLVSLAEENITKYVDMARWNERAAKIADGKERIAKLVDSL